MKRLRPFIIAQLIIALFLSPVSVMAHSGRTDGNGGHKDNKNKSGLGSYHYHHGYSAHLHNNGICPYEKPAAKATAKPADSKNDAGASATSPSLTKAEIKKYQEKLNNLGYDCGTPDGIAGKKTKSAISDFQKDNKLTVSGRFDTETIAAIDNKVSADKKAG